MKFAHRLAHLVFPRESNNQKAKLLHSSGLTFLALLLVALQLVISLVPKIKPSILGFAANISPSEVIRLTNEKRLQSGLSPLTENPTLSQAAQAKGADMLNRGYWAHVAPDGTQPWKFFTDAGYKYRYAGENLARDFSNPTSAVEAWMASPTHKDNLLSPKYKEIGIAVVEGRLAGIETTIIVQLFGTQYTDTLPVVPVAQAKTSVNSASTFSSSTPSSVLVSPSPVVISSGESIEPPSGKTKTLTSPFRTTKSVSLMTVGFLLMILMVDGVVTSRRKIARIGGRTFAHIAFLGMILAVVIILKAGQII